MRHTVSLSHYTGHVWQESACVTVRDFLHLQYKLLTTSLETFLTGIFLVNVLNYVN